VDKIVLTPVTLGIADFGLRDAECPASPRLIAPNPVGPELLTHCLRENKDLVLYDMTGRMVTPGTIKEHGFYVVQDQKKMFTQKVMVIK
jgi:hypothetical protein